MQLTETTFSTTTWCGMLLRREYIMLSKCINNFQSITITRSGLIELEYIGSTSRDMGLKIRLVTLCMIYLLHKVRKAQVIRELNISLTHLFRTIPIL